LVATLLVAGCEPAEPDESRLARLEAESASALADVREAERALRAYDAEGRLEELEARYDAETRRMEAREVPSEESDTWRAMMDSLRAELDVLRTAPLDLQGPTGDSVLVRLRSEYYAAQDRYTLTRLAIGFADGQ
jgi:hypothetical protein